MPSEDHDEDRAARTATGLHTLLRSADLGLTLGARKRLESELLRLSATPDACNAKLRGLGIEEPVLGQIKAALKLDDDQERVYTPFSATDVNFCRSKGLRGSAKQSEKKTRPLRMLCLHGFASNNEITKLQTEFGLGIESRHGIACDMLASDCPTTLGSDDASGNDKQLSDPTLPSTTLALVEPVKSVSRRPQEEEDVWTTLKDQAAQQNKDYKARFDRQQHEQREARRAAECSEYLGEITCRLSGVQSPEAPLMSPDEPCGPLRVPV